MKRCWSCAIALLFLATAFSAAQQAGEATASTAETSKAGPENSEPIHVSREVMQSLLVKRVNPHYPDDAREAHLQGSVVVQAVIGKDGAIKNVMLISGHPMLAPAALEAVKRWKFKPFLQNGQPVDVKTEVVVKFTLR
jgi:protein TonB